MNTVFVLFMIAAKGREININTLVFNSRASCLATKEKIESLEKNKFDTFSIECSEKEISK